MAYRICYEKTSAVKKNSAVVSERKQILMRLVVVLVICCVGLLILGGNGDNVVNFLLPGDPEITKNALSTMTDEIKSGNSVREAIAAFCQEIIVHAQTTG